MVLLELVWVLFFPSQKHWGKLLEHHLPSRYIDHKDQKEWRKLPLLSDFQCTVIGGLGMEQMWVRTLVRSLLSVRSGISHVLSMKASPSSVLWDKKIKPDSKIKSPQLAPMSLHANISQTQCLFSPVQKLKLFTVGLGVLGCTFWLFCWIVWKSARDHSAATAVPRPASVSCSAFGHSLSLCSLAGDLTVLWRWFAMTQALAGKGPQTGNERDGAGTSPQSSLAGLASPCPWPRDPWGSVGTAISHREPGSFLGTYFAVCFVSSLDCVNASESHSVVSDSLQPHGLYSPWNSPGQNTGVGSLSLLQGILPTQGLNPGLLHCRQILYQLSHQGSLTMWEADPNSCSYLSGPVPHSTDGSFLLHSSISQLPTFLPRSLLTCLWLNRRQVIGG